MWTGEDVVRVDQNIRHWRLLLELFPPYFKFYFVVKTRNAIPDLNIGI